MREGWEYKKLGDLTTTINGLWTGKKPPFVNVAVVRNTNFTKDCKLDMTNVAYLDVEEKQFSSRKLQYGDIIIEKSGGSDKQPVGRPVLFNIADGDYSFSNFTSTLRIIDRKEITPEFLHYSLWGAYLRGITHKMQAKTTGIHNLDFKAYLKINIPVPSVFTQQQIVSELDLLSGVIEKQKAQLEELDKLAQSIFYDMFGDPITNNLSWDIKFLGDVCSKITDGSHNPPAGIEYSEYLMLSSKNVTNQGFTFYEPRYLTKEQFETENKRTTIQKGDVFLVIVGAGVGKSCVYEANNPITLQRSVAVLKPCYDVLNSNYLNRFLIASHSFICNEAKGAAQKGIYLNQLSKVIIPLPPLSLQQEFAAKVEVIESMKAKVRQSLSEAETLFNSRMDYYFN